MEVNASRVKALRSERGWTQQHLADACDLSLRTIQRVEKTGAASNETLQGLCAVFEIDRAQLQVVPTPTPERMGPVQHYAQPLLLLFALLLGALMGAVTMYLLQS